MKLRKWASLLVAFSLSFSLLSGVPARATETTTDPEEDAAAVGSTADEEETASGGADEDTGEEEDVMTTLSKEDGTPVDSDEEDASADSGENETPADSGENETPADSGENATPADSGENETPADSGENETPADSGENETPADSGENETPVDSGENETPDNAGPSLPFEDVPREHWSFPFVLYAYEHNLVRGVSDTAFNPTGVMTRAAFVTVLYRLSAAIEGADMTIGEAAFTDIGDINAEFQSAILWGVKHGIVTGKDPETFAPRENVSRQQMCAILVRFLRDYLRYDLSEYAVESAFADNDTISNYAKEAVSISKAMGLLDGREVDGVIIFDPAGSASRAAVVKVLSNAVQMIPDLQKLPEPETPADTGDSETDDAGESGSSGGGSSGRSVDDTSKDLPSGTSGGRGSGSGSSSGGSSSGSSSGGSSGSSSGGSGGSSGGSSSGSSGGSSGGGSGSSGGSSSGGGSGSGGSGGSSAVITPIGGDSDSGNTTPAKEPENAPAVFASVDKIVTAYENNPPQGEPEKSYMDLIVPVLKEMSEARKNGAIVDENYFKTHYSTQLAQLVGKYDTAPLEDLLKLTEYARTLGSTNELKEVLSYFGLLEILIG